MTRQEIRTNDTLMRHLTAFGNNDMDAILSDYEEHSEILTLERTYKGLQAIREFFESMFELIPTGSFFEMKKLTVSRNIAHIIWASKSETANIVFGTDTFVIQNEKIVSHTVATHIL
ncbi:MAG: nuclear transport factor 2 family protein [Flavobacterium sp.]|uniref:nuclear transport factor 2 family protein n=1 Tax=Flavobacterium sp. TaxID=239 RepID=UPI0012240756|nr:nuclear transport factor 2 family protein [Flavobacterium sp.]RZJ66803.1 MAG: nuclear transport factor 2 family protein [Flavobacterium sp.]